MLSLGMILKRMSLLSDPKDIFFLRYEEIKRLTHSSFAESGQTLSLVSARKKEHDQYRNDPLGDILVFSEGAMIPFALDKTDASGILQGIGCSLGQCTGKAHVVDSVLGTMSVPEGRILVAPSIDPGLTPLFLTAKGLVTEIGGVLSHGATVAREYGLPAVVGVQNATKLIKNGQTITVDGITGKVFLGNLDKGV